MNTCLQIGKTLLKTSYISCRTLLQMVIGILEISFIGFRKIRNCLESGYPYNWQFSIANPMEYMTMGSGLCYDSGVPPKKNENTKSENEQLVSQLLSKIEDLENQNKKQEEMITKHLGQKVERATKGKVHNTTDTPLAGKLTSMFEKEWRETMDVFKTDKQITGIRLLSKILEECQKLCEDKAREQLSFFINPFEIQECSESVNIKQALPDDEDSYNLQKIRRNVSMHQSVKSALRKSFEKIYIDLDEYKNLDDLVKGNEQPTRCLDKFVGKCCDLCWQFAIADPQVNLEFAVKEQLMEEIEDRFSSYPLTEEVNEQGKSNTVMEVVWPACVTKLEGGKMKVLAKGSVILYE